MTDPDPEDTAPEAPDTDPRDDDVGERGLDVSGPDPTGPEEDHHGAPE